MKIRVNGLKALLFQRVIILLPLNDFGEDIHDFLTIWEYLEWDLEVTFEDLHVDGHVLDVAGLEHEVAKVLLVDEKVLVEVDPEDIADGGSSLKWRLFCRFEGLTFLGAGFYNLLNGFS